MIFQIFEGIVQSQIILFGSVVLTGHKMGFSLISDVEEESTDIDEHNRDI